MSLSDYKVNINHPALVPEGVSEGELRNDIIKYNLFYSLRPKRVFRLLFDRVGPAGWFELPKRWFLKPGEWYSLLRFMLKIGLNFILAIFSIAKYKLMSILHK